MNKIGWLLLVLILLGLATWYVTQGDMSDAHTVSDSWEREMRLENTADIHRVLITSRNLPTTELVRRGDEWYVQDSFMADRRTVGSMMDAFRNLEIAYIPTAAAYGPIMKEIAGNGIKVQAFDQGGGELRNFYIGGTSPDGTATQMLVEGSDQPYMMEIKGFIGTLRPRFYKPIEDWRDKQVFRGLTERLDTLMLVYPGQRSESFILSRDGDNYRLSPYYPTTRVIQKRLHEDQIRRYLTDVENKLYVQNFNNDNPKRDSLSARGPFAQLYMRYRDGTKHEYNFIPIIISEDEKAFRGDELKEGAYFRYYMTERDGDFMVAQRHILNNLFWGYTSFYN